SLAVRVVRALWLRVVVSGVSVRLAGGFVIGLLIRSPPGPALFPYTTLFRSEDGARAGVGAVADAVGAGQGVDVALAVGGDGVGGGDGDGAGLEARGADAWRGGRVGCRAADRVAGDP